MQRSTIRARPCRALRPAQSQSTRWCYVAIVDCVRASQVVGEYTGGTINKQFSERIELGADLKEVDEPAQVEGRVARLFADDGYGFIDAGALGEVYFHRNSVADGRFAELEEGSRVRFVIAEDESEHGAQASTVHALH